MILRQAQAILTEVLQPHSYDHFFEEIVGRQILVVPGNETSDRALILGNDPKRLILDAFEEYAPTLTCHAAAATLLPPSARAVADADAFHALIREYHKREYTVRIPEVTNLSPVLRRLIRALEIILEIPVGVVIFWSAPGAKAPVHQDEYDVIVLQLVGEKRWFISTDPPTFANTWKGFGEGPPPLDRHRTIDVAPGDLLYLPRGTAHTVQSPTESIHLSIGFVPVTVRDAINAALDHLSDLDRPLRMGATNRADDLSRGEGLDFCSDQVRLGLEKLIASCKSDKFIQVAMEHRLSRVIFDLPKLPPPDVQHAISINSRIRHHPLGIAKIVAMPGILDIRLPGGRFLIHQGAEESLRYIVTTPEFRVADIPGGLDDEVRLALVNRLMASGFLQAVNEVNGGGQA